MYPTNLWKQGARGLANRSLVSTIPFNGNIIKVSKQYTEDEILDKIANLTTGNFYIKGPWVQFENDEDYINFSLGVTRET